MSVNTVILIVLGLVVLLVLILIFNKYVGGGSETIDNTCERGGGTCVTSLSDQQCDNGMPAAGLCPKDKPQVCCKKK